MRVHKVAQRIVNNHTLRNKTYYLENVRKGLLSHPSQVYWTSEPASTEYFIRRVDEALSWIDQLERNGPNAEEAKNLSDKELDSLLKKHLVFDIPNDMLDMVEIIGSEYLEYDKEKRAYHFSMDYDGTKNFLSRDKEGKLVVDWEKIVELVSNSSEETNILAKGQKAQRETEKLKFKLDNYMTDEEIDAHRPDFDSIRKQVPAHYVDQLEQDMDFMVNNLPEVDSSFVEHMEKYNKKLAAIIREDALDLIPEVIQDCGELDYLMEILRADPDKEGLPKYDHHDPFFVDEFLPGQMDQIILEIEYDNWDINYADEFRRWKKPIDEIIAENNKAGRAARVNKDIQDERNANTMVGGLSEREIFEKKLFKRVSELIEQNKGLLADIASLKQEGATVEDSTAAAGSSDKKSSEKFNLSDGEFWAWTKNYLNFEKDLYDDFAERGEDAVKEFVAKKKEAAKKEDEN
eukprot:CAMPEP_0117424520 /NCGR_PEP_ID=MMETSP0758-20121206/4918_1 /TAXON_ID=63605 /ORGANISM="Percolomonas cosmopolitus, Strain AE-1 (ATCC 50343)" /LENGTH=460 /DNA_ID=CAMNT_0005208339 /DNA_START=23 /DNA_END=1405 /DNA_ORIENTATION=-